MFGSIVDYIKSFFTSHQTLTLYSDPNTFCKISSNGAIDVSFSNDWIWDAQENQRKLELNIYDKQYVELQCFRSAWRKYTWYLDDVLIDIVLAFLPIRPAYITFGTNSLPFICN